MDPKNVLLELNIKNKNPYSDEINRSIENKTMKKEDWERIFSDTYKISKSTRVRSEYIRFTHKMIYSQNRLHHMRLANSSECKICKDSMCDTEHLLEKCVNANFVWSRLEQIMQPLILGKISKMEKLYGAFEEDESTRQQKNLVYLAAKCEIRRAYLDVRPTNIANILDTLSEWKKIETKICGKPSQIYKINKLCHFLTYAID